MINNKPAFSRQFCLTVLGLIVIAAIFHHNLTIAMWFGFCVAGFSAIGNDSIQTLGTFISSNEKVHWGYLLLFIGGLLIIILAIGWQIDDGSITFDRLAQIPQPQKISFVELLAPIALLVMTRLRMPVSTTFLLLSVFSKQIVIEKMLIKSVLGYAAAFIAAVLIWSLLLHFARKFTLSKKYPHVRWRVFQFLSTGFLWCAWIMHDTANIAVFLPRQLSLSQLLAALIILFLITTYILYQKGGRIQRIVTTKSYVHDIRAATLVDLVFAILLIFFKELNNLPMSTTWVFLGLLAGRELAFHLRQARELHNNLWRVISSDVIKATIGIIISLIIASWS